MEFVDTLLKVLPKIGGWHEDCVAISLSGRGNVWCHSKMPTKYRSMLGVWTDDSFWGNTTKGFSSPIFTLHVSGGEHIKPVTQEEYEALLQRS